MGKKIALFLWLALLFFSCSDDCFKATGDITVQNREVTAFEAIEVFDNVNVIIKQANQYNVSVKAGKNLQSNIQVEVVNNRLKIKNSTTCNWVRNQKIVIWVEISTPNLKNIEHWGYGNIQSFEKDTLNFSELDILIGGQGDVILTLSSTNLLCRLRKLGNIILQGKAQNLEVFTFDHGFFYGKNLIAQNCKANNSGEGNFEIYAEQSLNGTIGSIGSIIYFGNPKSLITNFLERAKGQIIAGK